MRMNVGLVLDLSRRNSTRELQFYSSVMMKDCFETIRFTFRACNLLTVQFLTLSVLILQSHTLPKPFTYCINNQETQQTEEALLVCFNIRPLSTCKWGLPNRAIPCLASSFHVWLRRYPFPLLPPERSS